MIQHLECVLKRACRALTSSVINAQDKTALETGRDESHDKHFVIINGNSMCVPLRGDYEINTATTKRTQSWVSLEP